MICTAHIGEGTLLKKRNRPLTGVRKTGLDRNYEMSICQAGLDNEKPLYSVKT